MVLTGFLLECFLRLRVFVCFNFVGFGFGFVATFVCFWCFVFAVIVFYGFGVFQIGDFVACCFCVWFEFGFSSI